MIVKKGEPCGVKAEKVAGGEKEPGVGLLELVQRGVQTTEGAELWGEVSEGGQAKVLVLVVVLCDDGEATGVGLEGLGDVRDQGGALEAGAGFVLAKAAALASCEDEDGELWCRHCLCRALL